MDNTQFVAPRIVSQFGEGGAIPTLVELLGTAVDSDDQSAQETVTFSLFNTAVSDDSSTDSDGEPSGPTRRKRSSLAQRTRRSLLRAVEAIETFLVPLSVSAPGVQSNVPLCRMTEAQPHPLSINSSEPSAPEQLQVVLFDRRPREMVVFQEVRTKVKYKPKVLLDLMTVKTFDRLMLQGGEVKDADHGHENWIEARKLWSDRAHYFNCIMRIMRQVQGRYLLGRDVCI